MAGRDGWEAVRKFERERRLSKYKDMAPAQRLEIYEDLYRTALKVAPEKIRQPWPGDENWHKIPHLRRLVETRKLLNRLVKR